LMTTSSRFSGISRSIGPPAVLGAYVNPSRRS
jgi:hypothetical protein